jgi:hypothetical protein
MNEYYSTGIGPSKLMAFFPANDVGKGPMEKAFEKSYICE